MPSPTVCLLPACRATASSTNAHSDDCGAIRCARSSIGRRKSLANPTPRAEPATNDLVDQIASLR
eukprot:7721442-Pyramimonas_sp.AAC.1